MKTYAILAFLLLLATASAYESFIVDTLAPTAAFVTLQAAGSGRTDWDTTEIGDTLNASQFSDPQLAAWIEVSGISTCRMTDCAQVPPIWCETEPIDNPAFTWRQFTTGLYTVDLRNVEGSRSMRIQCNDSAGNTAAQMQDFKGLDLNNPTSSISYTAGYQTSTTIAVTQTRADPGPAPSGIASSDTQEKHAPLTNGAAGSWTSYATTDTSGGNFTFGGTNCYAHQLRYQSADNSGRVSGYAEGGITYIDTGTPSAVASLASSTHPSPSLAYASQDPAFSWSNPQPCSGTQYYAYTLVTTPTYSWTGSETTTTGTTASFTGKTESTWYFHIRARNNANTWGTSASMQVNIDLGPPAAPSITDPSGLAIDSPTQITITVNAVTDPNGPVQYQLEETTGNPGGTDFTTWQVSRTFIDNGLTPGMQYCYKAKATDLWSPSSWGNTVCAYAAANVPSAPTVSLVPEGSPLNSGFSNMRITVNENGNPSTVQYAILEEYSNKFMQADGTLGAAEAWQTYAQWGGATGLTTAKMPDNYAYSLKAKAKNTGGAVTGYSPPTSVVGYDRTGPASPVLTAVANNASNRVDLTWYEGDNGLRGYWPFENAAEDWSPNRYDGTLTNSPTWTSAGKSGGAYSFNSNAGEQEHIHLGSYFPEITSSFTILLWMKPGAGQPYEYADVFGNHDGSGTKGMVMQQNSWNTNYYNFAYGDGSAWKGTLASDMFFTADQWEFVAIVKNATHVAIYKNSTLMGVVSAPTNVVPNSAMNLTLAQGWAGGQTMRYWNGTLDEFRVYNRALTQREITDVMQSGSIRHGLLRANATNGPFQPVNGLWDDFSDGDHSDWTKTGIGGAGANWTVENGQLSITDYSVASDSQSIAFKGNTGWTDYIYSVDVMPQAGNYAGIYFRDTAYGNGYWWLIGITGAGEAGYNNFNWIEYNASTTLKMGQWNNLRVKVTGSDPVNVKLYMDGVKVKEVNLAGANAKPTGRIGVMNYDSHVHFDNVNVIPFITNTFIPDTAANDANAPPTPANVALTPATTSMQVSWPAVTDNGTDYWHFAKAFDNEGNEDNYYTNSNLVAYWALNDSSTGSADTQVSYDASGTNTLTMYGGNWIGGQYGTGVRLDGINDYAVTNNLAALVSSTDSVTLEAWFKANAAGVIVAEFGSGGGVNPSWHDSQIEILSSGEVKIRVWGLAPVSLGTVPFGNWHHVVLRYDKTSLTLDGFLDGVKSTTSASGDRQSPWESGYDQRYALGPTDATNMGSGAYLDGVVDEFRVYKAPLADGEVVSNYHRGLLKKTTVLTGTKDYYVNGAGLNNWYTASPQTATSLTPNTNYCYTVLAEDNALNPSGTSTQACKYTLPLNPTISASSHTSGQWSNDSTIDVTLNAGAAIAAGFHYVWDKTSNTPVTTGNTAWDGLAQTFTATSDGDWYLHVIAKNPENALNPSGTVNFGPYKIDSIAPSTPTLLATQYSQSGCPTFKWIKSTDTGSGMKDYELQVARDTGWVTDPTGTDNDGIDTGFSVTQASCTNGGGNECWYTPATTHWCPVGPYGGPSGMNACLCQGKWVWRVQARDNVLTAGSWAQEI
jgi:hypothetical protein